MCETGYMCEHFDTDKLKKNPTEYWLLAYDHTMS